MLIIASGHLRPVYEDTLGFLLQAGFTLAALLLFISIYLLVVMRLVSDVFVHFGRPAYLGIPASLLVPALLACTALDYSRDEVLGFNDDHTRRAIWFMLDRPSAL